MKKTRRTKRIRPPTNSELLLAIERWRSEDRKETQRRLNEQDGKILGLASKGDVTTVQTTVETMSKAMFDEHSELKLATKADVMPVVEWHRNLVAAANLTAIGGKWGSRFVLGLAAILVGLGVITGGFKGLVAALFGWAVGSH